MASKKPAVTRTARPEPKTESPSNSKMKVWRVPVLLLMVAVGATGLVFAVRESSNAPQAAASTATVAPEAAAHEAPAPKAANTVRAAVPTTGVDKKAPETERASAPRPVSITGCVQRNDNGFVLKDTEGSDAPRARSWKSGFLRRGNASVMLTDTADTAHLASHVGQRVSVTGALVDRDMHVLSLRRLSATCQ